MQRTRTQYKEQTERGGYLYPLETYRFHFNLENKNKPQICVSYHWHPELEILMIERGELTVTIEDREYTGKTGDLFSSTPAFSIPCTPGREKTLSTRHCIRSRVPVLPDVRLCTEPLSRASAFRQAALPRKAGKSGD